MPDIKNNPIHPMTTDIVIIGAGPSGAVAACLLKQLGHNVVILEKTKFPRFVIGESLLPQCLQVLDKAGCLGSVKAANFQNKVGATFQHKGKYVNINFDEKMTSLQSEIGELLKAEKESKKDLLNIFKELGYAIEL